MNHWLIFGLLSVPSLAFSWRSMFSFKNHGLYRFFGWECIIWLFSANYGFWFIDPFSPNQIIAWVFLSVSLCFAIAGFIKLKQLGKSASSRDDKALFKFEKTIGLVNTGIYKYIRHPLYSSLIFLSLGIFLKNPGSANSVIALLSLAFFYITAIFDEKECLAYFGEPYRNYMKSSKMFVPFLL